MVVAIDSLAVRRPAAMGDPGSRTGAHDRLQRGDEAACRMLDADALRGMHMDVRFPVRNRDDLIAAQFAAQRRAQRLLGPALLALVQGAVDALEVAQQRAHVAFDRLQLRRRRPGRRPQDAFAMKQGAQARHPPAPRQLRDHDGNQGDTGTQSEEKIEKVAPRFLGAAGEEGQVVDQDHGGARAGLRRGGAHDHEQGAMRRDDGALPIREGRQVGALHFRWKRLRRDHGGVAPRAQADRVQPFVVGDAIEKAGEPHRSTSTAAGRSRVRVSSARRTWNASRDRAGTTASSTRRRAAPQPRRKRRAPTAAGTGSAAKGAWSAMAPSPAPVDVTDYSILSANTHAHPVGIGPIAGRTRPTCQGRGGRRNTAACEPRVRFRAARGYCRRGILLAVTSRSACRRRSMATLSDTDSRAVMDVIVGDDILGDVGQDPDSSGDQRGEIGEFSVLRGKIAKLVIAKMGRQRLDGLHHFPRWRRQAPRQRFLQCVQQRMADAAAQVFRRNTLRAQAGLEREFDALRAKVVERLRLVARHVVGLAQRLHRLQVIVPIAPERQGGCSPRVCVFGSCVHPRSSRKSEAAPIRA